MQRTVFALLGAVAITGCTVPHEAERATQAVFPNDWLGSWSGEVTPHSAAGAGERFGMRLDIARTDDPARFDWTITYSGSAGTQVRAYSLLVRDAAAGRYAIDERNGIVLEQQLIGGAMYAWFDIGGMRLCVREQLVAGRRAGDDRIEVEIATARDGDAVTTGAGGEASSRPVLSVQRATLRRLAAEQ